MYGSKTFQVAKGADPVVNLECIWRRRKGGLVGIVDLILIVRDFVHHHRNALLASR